MKRLAASSALASAVLVAGPALACGVCVEDKVAATYDHAVVTRAPGEGKVVVFAEPRTRGDASDAVKRVAAAAARARGVDARTVRSSVSPAAVSFALDPRQASPVQAAAAIAAATRVPGLDLAVIRVLR